MDQNVAPPAVPTGGGGRGIAPTVVGTHVRIRARNCRQKSLDTVSQMKIRIRLKTAAPLWARDARVGESSAPPSAAPAPETTNTLARQSALSASDKQFLRRPKKPESNLGITTTLTPLTTTIGLASSPRCLEGHPLYCRGLRQSKQRSSCSRAEYVGKASNQSLALLSKWPLDRALQSWPA